MFDKPAGDEELGLVLHVAVAAGGASLASLVTAVNPVPIVNRTANIRTSVLVIKPDSAAAVTAETVSATEDKTTTRSIDATAAAGDAVIEKVGISKGSCCVIFNKSTTAILTGVMTKSSFLNSNLRAAVGKNAGGIGRCAVTADYITAEASCRTAYHRRRTTFARTVAIDMGIINCYTCAAINAYAASIAISCITVDTGIIDSHTYAATAGYDAATMATSTVAGDSRVIDSYIAAGNAKRAAAGTSAVTVKDGITDSYRSIAGDANRAAGHTGIIITTSANMIICACAGG